MRLIRARTVKGFCKTEVGGAMDDPHAAAAGLSLEPVVRDCAGHGCGRDYTGAARAP